MLRYWGLNVLNFVWGKDTEKNVIIPTLNYTKARYHGLHHVVIPHVLRKGLRRHYQLLTGTRFVTHLQ